MSNKLSPKVKVFGMRLKDRKWHEVADSLIGSYSTILNSDSSMPRGHKLIFGERQFAQI
ncbi:MAG: hypothetical protein QXV32_06640 [Conexivisphaerales archaeon]